MRPSLLLTSSADVNPSPIWERHRRGPRADMHVVVLMYKGRFENAYSPNCLEQFFAPLRCSSLYVYLPHHYRTVSQMALSWPPKDLGRPTSFSLSHPQIASQFSCRHYRTHQENQATWKWVDCRSDAITEKVVHTEYSVRGIGGLKVPGLLRCLRVHQAYCSDNLANLAVS
ncbi:hypothetical protein N7495_004842 [Penicillium taxi]|uniref:uncharacterized protein n=1 Tax=Penicillium taxi TaxID=168475 RepID=UPI0025453403|nr:uncharacterized protein N7495_004842 [Penicillium taxi]KAJ5900098.1 hypothetical protein N7495_004842 [Penicillium taxi]